MRACVHARTHARERHAGGDARTHAQMDWRMCSLYLGKAGCIIPPAMLRQRVKVMAVVVGGVVVVVVANDMAARNRL